MYRPVRPVTLKRIKGDSRQACGPAVISARMESAGIADAELCAQERRGHTTLYWLPK
jgi:hypothetical protein